MDNNNNSHIFDILILLGITLLSLSPLVHSGIPFTHDGINHVARLSAYVQAIYDGQFPPRWAGQLNYTYGSPVLNFFYPLPGYIGSILHIIFLQSYENSFKLSSIIAFLLAPIGMYLWVNNKIHRNTALLVSFMYGFLPYHFLNLYVRGDIGELYAYGLLPFLFFSIDHIQNKPSVQNIIWGAIVYALFILSHHGVALFITPILIGYSIMIVIKKAKILVYSLTIFLGGALISSFFWIPALYEQKYLHSTVLLGTFYKEQFLPLSKTFISPWKFGDAINSSVGLSPHLGLYSTVIIIFGIFQIFRKVSLSLKYWLCIFCISLFLSTKFSVLFWENVPFMKLLQFPWRFMGIASFASIALLPSLIKSKLNNTKLTTVVILLLIICSIPYVQVNGYIHHDDEYYKTFPGSTYFHGEASTVWTAGDPSSFPDYKYAIIEQTAQINELFRSSHKHILTVNSVNGATVLDNTLYYPGWTATVNGISVPIEFQNPQHRGLISFRVPKGISHVVIHFEETKIRKLSNILSIITGVGYCMIYLFGKYNHIKHA